MSSRRGLLGLAWIVLLGCAAIQHWSVAQLGWLSYLYYIPGIFCLPVVGVLLLVELRSGRGWARVGGMLVLLGLWVWLSGFCWGRSTPEPSRLRVVTTNVQSYTADLNGVGEVLAQLQPDVLLLQEVWTLRHLEVLKAHLPGYQFVQAGGFVNGDYLKMGVFVGSRWPIQGSGTLDRAAWVDVQSEQGQVRAIGVHGLKRFEFGPEDVDATLAMQKKQALSVAGACDRSLCLVGGDFNAPPTAPSLKLLRKGLSDSFAQAGCGWGLTFPAKLPVLRIDQILHGPGLRCVRCWTVPTGSDHLAVVADYVTAP